jgi:hypothetical protein
VSTPSPIEDIQAWAFCWLGGEMLPAVCEISGDTGWDIDVKKTKGQDGAVIQDNGIQPAKLRMTLTFVPAFWSKVQEILERVSPTQIGGKRKPVEIRNARTDARGIHSVYIETIGLPDVDSKGVMSISLGLLQWIPEPKATKAAGKGKAPKSAIERDPGAPGSFISPLNPPVVTDVIDPENQFTPQADRDFLDFMQTAL